MYRQLAGILTALFLVLNLGGCGSGEQAGGTSTAASTRAVTKVKTAGLLPSGQVIGAVWLTLSIPRGVTVALDPATSEPKRGVVSLVGASDPAMVFQSVKYTAPTAAAAGELQFIVMNAQGFGPIEYITVQLDITPGYFPAAGDFKISNFTVSDIGTYTATPIANPTVTVDIS